MQKIIRRRELRAATGLGITKIYQLIAVKKFPRPIPLGDRAVGWLESEIAEWQRERMAARDKQAA